MNPLYQGVIIGTNRQNMKVKPILPKGSIKEIIENANKIALAKHTGKYRDYKTKPVILCDIKGREIKRFRCQRDVADFLKVSQPSICKYIKKGRENKPFDGLRILKELEQ